jgi:nitric oxide dioxygenase
LTPAQVALVQDSFAKVVPMQEAAAALFIIASSRSNPSMKPLFAKADMAAQGQKLMLALAALVAGPTRPETVVPAVQDLARPHVGYGVTEAQYASVGAARLWTLEQGLGEAFTPEVKGGPDGRLYAAFRRDDRGGEGGLSGHARSAAISALKRCTTAGSPSKTLWLIRKWPMLTSETSGMAAMGPTVS